MSDMSMLTITVEDKGGDPLSRALMDKEQLGTWSNGPGEKNKKIKKTKQRWPPSREKHTVFTSDRYEGKLKS